MAFDDGINPRREGGADMGKREQVRKDRAAVATVSEQLTALEKMTVGELVVKYREVFGVPTRTRNKSYLRKKVGWRIQELAEGGLSPRALAKIEELAPQAPVRWRTTQQPAAAPAATAVAVVATPIPDPDRDPRLPLPGSVIVRVHKGVEHRVTVLDDGFEYNGERHPTLSQLARRITGTPWNGFLFFGLQSRAQPAPSEEAAG
jgi:hypothetical protein